MGTAAVFVVLYSYSIYLWQGVFSLYTIRGFKQFFHVELTGFSFFAWYFFGCVVFGIVMAWLIEFPVLRFRDRLFPALQEPAVSPAPAFAPATSTGGSI